MFHPLNNTIPQTTALHSVADSSNSSSSSTEQLLHDAHMSRQQSNVNKQRRGTKRKAKSQTDSSTSGQPLRHDYYDRQFSIAYIHYSRYSLASGAEYKVHWTNFPDCREDTWETERTLQEDCPQILQEFKDNL